MSLLDSIFKRSSQKFVPAGLFSFYSPTSMPKMKEADYSKAYMGWVYACTNAIAERVASIELHVEQRKGKDWQIIDNHPALKLLHNVRFDTIPIVV